MDALPLQQETALSQPPQTKIVVVTVYPTARTSASRASWDWSGRITTLPVPCEPADAGHHIGQFLPRSPARRLTEPAVGREGELFRGRLPQAQVALCQRQQYERLQRRIADVEALPGIAAPAGPVLEHHALVENLLDAA